MHWLTRGVVYGIVTLSKVLRYLPYPVPARERETLSGRTLAPHNTNWTEQYSSVPLRTEAQEVREMKRGVGYCMRTECEDYAKGVFLLNHGNTFYCPRCREVGTVKAEVGSFSGEAEVFKEVRVEYNFDPINERYQETAIVRDESLWGRNNVYTLQSPLIKTERRALKVAEAVLANLNRFGLTPNGIPRTTETILSFDDSAEEFARKCRILEAELENSALKQSRP